jgi:hypothetical protein
MQYQLDRAVDVCKNVWRHKADAAGWLGMAFIHGATVPVSLRALATPSAPLPPLSMVLMIWTGLALFLLNAIAKRDKLYMASNGVGFALQTLLLTLVLWR